MALVIKNNTSAVNTLNKLDANAAQMAKNLEKVSTGMKINSAGDDASGYAISEKMRVQARSLGQDDMNAQNAISLLTVAEGAVQNTVDILRGMKEKAIEAANDTNSDADRAIIQKTINQNIDQINDNAAVTYNDIRMLDGSHNDYVVPEGSYTHMTNKSLSAGTTLDTKIVELLDRSNNELGIHEDDTLKISWVKDGVTKILKFHPLVRNVEWAEYDEETDETITGITESPLTLAGLFVNGSVSQDVEWANSYYGNNDYSYVGKDQFGDDVYTVDKENGLTIKAKEPQVKGQLAGFTLTVLDSSGSPRRSVDNVLNNFTEMIAGQNPSPNNALVMQIGPKANQSLSLGFRDMRAAALGLEAEAAEQGAIGGETYVEREITYTQQYNSSKKLNVSTQEAANAAINVLNNALQRVLDQQTKIGAEASRLEYTSANITIANENTQASESVIRDADMAKEHMNYTKSSILTQAAQAMLAQANQNSSQVLSLLQG